MAKKNHEETRVASKLASYLREGRDGDQGKVIPVLCLAPAILPCLWIDLIPPPRSKSQPSRSVLPQGLIKSTRVNEDITWDNHFPLLYLGGPPRQKAGLQRSRDKGLAKPSQAQLRAVHCLPSQQC